MPAPARMSVEEYLCFERASETKHEFYDGQIFAMAGASRQHVRICVNLARELSLALRGSPCEPLVMDMRTKVRATGLYTYPDVVVVCGEAQFEDEQLDTLLNPVAVIEVLSPSTERYDRGKKFAMYAELDSLKEYVLISQDEVRIEQFIREGDSRWRLSIHSQPLDELTLLDGSCRILVNEIYSRVEFPEHQSLRD